MKTLLVYYSWTGNTRKLAQKITSKLKCDVEEIYEVGRRGGKLGFMTGGFQAFLGMKSKIEKPKKPPSDYDLVILGSPVWAGRISPALRGYLSECGEVGEYAIFMTQGGKDHSKALENVREITGRNPAASLIVSEKDIAKADVPGFLDSIKAKSP